MRLGGFMIAAENCGKVAERGKPRSISDAQQVFPFAKVAPEAHAFRDLECRDHTPFDLLAGLDCSFSDQRTSVVTAAQAGSCLSQTDRVWSAAAALEQSRSK